MVEAPAPLLKLTTDFYREFFNKPGMETVDRWGDHGSTPLTIEISVAEVAYAASKLKNGKAPGPDGIPCELLKYAGMEVKIKIVETLNKMFATQDPLAHSAEQAWQRAGGRQYTTYHTSQRLSQNAISDSIISIATGP